MRRWVRIQAKLVWRKLKRSPKVKSMRENGWNAMKAVPLIVSFVVLAWWLEQTTSKTISDLKSIPILYLSWGLGMAGGTTLLVWLLYSPARRSRYSSTPALKRLAWFVMLVLIVGMFWLYGGKMLGYLEEKFSSLQSSIMDKRPATHHSTHGTVRTIMVGREWSEIVHFPQGRQHFRFDRIEEVEYEAQIQTGKIYRYPRGINKGLIGTQPVESIRFRLTDQDPNVHSVIIQIYRVP